MGAARQGAWGRPCKEHGMSEIDLGTLDSKGLEALAKRIAEAARVKKTAEKTAAPHEFNIPNATAKVYVDEQGNPRFSVDAPLFNAVSSEPNKYGAIFIASSKNGNRDYVALGAIPVGFGHDGEIAEIEWRVRLPNSGK